MDNHDQDDDQEKQMINEVDGNLMLNHMVYKFLRLSVMSLVVFLILNLFMTLNLTVFCVSFIFFSYFFLITYLGNQFSF